MSFFSTRDVKASRRPRRCEECRHRIALGEPYRACAQLWEGEFMTFDVHAECQDWASAVIGGDDGRGFLCEHDPADEDQEELADAIRANPPSDLVRSRLPAAWLKAVDAALAARPATVAARPATVAETQQPAAEEEEDPLEALAPRVAAYFCAHHRNAFGVVVPLVCDEFAIEDMRRALKAARQ